MIRVTQNWENLPLFPVCAWREVPIPMYTVTYTSHPNIGPVSCPHRGPSSNATGHPCCTGSAGATPFPSLAVSRGGGRAGGDSCPCLCSMKKVHSHPPPSAWSLSQPTKRTKKRSTKIKTTIHGQFSVQNKRRKQLTVKVLLALGEHRPAPAAIRTFLSGRGFRPTLLSEGGFSAWRVCTTQHTTRSLSQKCRQE